MDLKVNELVKKIEVYKTDLKNSLTGYISKIPDNPKIKRISENPNCFIIKSSDLGNNWSAEYHDTKYQARVIIDLINNKLSIESIQKCITQIVENGKYRISEGHMMYFNPQMREYLKELL